MPEVIGLNKLIRWSWKNCLAYQQSLLDFVARKAAQLTLSDFSENPLEVEIQGFDGLLCRDASTDPDDYPESPCPTSEHVEEANAKHDKILDWINRIASVGKVTVWNKKKLMWDWPIIHRPEFKAVKSKCIYLKTPDGMEHLDINTGDLRENPLYWPKYPKVWDLISQILVEESTASGFNKDGLKRYAQDLILSTHDEVTPVSKEVNRLHDSGVTGRIHSEIWKLYPDAARGGILPALPQPSSDPGESPEDHGNQLEDSPIFQEMLERMCKYENNLDELKAKIPTDDKKPLRVEPPKFLINGPEQVVVGGVKPYLLLEYMLNQEKAHDKDVVSHCWGPNPDSYDLKGAIHKANIALDAAKTGKSISINGTEVFWNNLQ